MQLLINAGFPITPTVVEMYSTLNKIMVSLNILDIHLRFEGMIVTSGTYNANIPNVWLDAMVAKVPAYSREDFIDYNTGCS